MEITLNTNQNTLEEYNNPAAYDAENRWGDGDDFYLTLALDVGGPVLDVACGTGSLARAIANEGLNVTGVDIVGGMLERARQLTGEEAVEWVLSDCRTMALGKQFRLAIMSGHAFQHLLTDADQQTFLATVNRHLENDGIFAFETRNLAAKNYGDSEDYRYWHSFQDERGRWTETLTASQFDANSMIDMVRIKRVVQATGEAHFSETHLRYNQLDQLNQLLHASGFEVLSQYGDWSKVPVSTEQPEIISICRKVAG